ncbi:hypothetical protein [Cellulomonas sp. SG140]|uniref:hypothetical protein n=1 Tax=Cellulomonas sp. SG140 TaxID=2976536 RepID=UPI0021E8352F|nr:hypothetical protein [Cellulomonas sp. SG140]
MHPELFLLLYQQRERQLEQLHARRAAAAERFEVAGTPVARPAARRPAVTVALSGLVARLRTTASSTVAVTPACCPAL